MTCQKVSYFVVVLLKSAQWKALLTYIASKCQKKKWDCLTHPALSQSCTLTEKEWAQVVSLQVTLNLCCGSLLSTYVCALPVMFGLTSCQCTLCSSSRSPQEKWCGPQHRCLSGRKYDSTGLVCVRNLRDLLIHVFAQGWTWPCPPPPNSTGGFG